MNLQTLKLLAVKDATRIWQPKNKPEQKMKTMINEKYKHFY